MGATTSQADVPTTPLAVRERLVEALELDLVGPGRGHPLAEERLPGWERPSNWYLTGFLIPSTFALLRGRGARARGAWVGRRGGVSGRGC